jgi:hypothetical protein
MWWVRARAAVAPASDLRPQARPGSSPSKLCDLRFVLRLEQVSCSGLDVATGSAMSGFLMFMAAPRAEQAAEFPLDGLLEIDENYYGGRSKPESRGCGHTDPNKSLMAIAIETTQPRAPGRGHQAPTPVGSGARRGVWRRGQQKPALAKAGDTVGRLWRKVKADWDAWNARSLAAEPIVA